MGERKVLNKYYPPDFDPAKLPKLKLTRDRQYVVRLMAPCTMRCLTCGNYVYKGKKFNARKETVLNEKYLGLPIFRFYIRCPQCLTEITFKTDPESTDYVVERGAYRTFQAETIAHKQAEQELQEKEEEEANNPMLALENRTKESRREMDILDVLEEIRDVNAQHEHVSFDQLMDKHLEKEREEEDEQERLDEALARAAFSSVTNKVKRLQDDSSSDEEGAASKATANKRSSQQESSDAKRPKTSSNKPTDDLTAKPSSTKALLQGLVKRKSTKQTAVVSGGGQLKTSTSVSRTDTTSSATTCHSSSLSLLAGYSDEESD